jgi:DNA-binding MarR family transcriptional regulator/N-acetylglutamate synthase-like GNAT family acetyltransferase
VNFYEEAGYLVFGTRLKRLSDRFIQDITRVYKTLNISFETSWFPIFFLLERKKICSVTEIARELSITHSAVSQMAVNLEQKGYIQFLSDPDDKRKRLIQFTHNGKKLIESLKPVWSALQRSMTGLMEERENAAHLLTALSELEESLNEKSFFERVQADLKIDRQVEIQITFYKNKYKTEFKNLIMNWLIDSQHGDIEDKSLINDPDKTIKNGKTCILLAVAEGQCAGSLVAENTSGLTRDIQYFIVNPEWQNRGIGKMLLDAFIKNSAECGCKKIRVALERQWSHAMKLFRQTGFDLFNVAARAGSENEIQNTFIMEYNIPSE